MGCYSGKVKARPGGSTYDGFTGGTLLTTPASPSKVTPPERELSEKGPGTMLVTNCGQGYATHQALARQLKVFDKGWVHQFNDVKNGDTGTLLAETTAETTTTYFSVVALRLHRNGGVVCINRSGVEAAGFNGVWNCGEISGDKLTRLDGTVSDILIESDTGLSTLDGVPPKFSTTLDGVVYTAELRDDKIVWDDGDVWTRLEGTPEAPPEPVSRLTRASSDPDAEAAAPEAVCTEEQRQLERSVSTNLAEAGTFTEAGAAPAVAESSAAQVSSASPRVPESTSASATAEAKRRFIAGSILYDTEQEGHKTRRERTGCCC